MPKAALIWSRSGRGLSARAAIVHDMRMIRSAPRALTCPRSIARSSGASEPAAGGKLRLSSLPGISALSRHGVPASRRAARRRVLRDLHHYLAIERDELVQRKLSGGVYTSAAGCTSVAFSGSTSVTLTGGERKAHQTLSAADRIRLRQMRDGKTGEPLWLWLGENGLPLERATWQAVFRRANERCARLGIDLEVHPHMLRHTFAVHILGLLLRQTVKAMRTEHEEHGTTLMSQQVKRMMLGDPLRKFQLLLGHRNRDTVFIYLDVLDEAQEIVLAALREWDEQAEALSRIDPGKEAA
jgi:Phage integrase family